MKKYGIYKSGIRNSNSDQRRIRFEKEYQILNTKKREAKLKHFVYIHNSKVKFTVVKSNAQSHVNSISVRSPLQHARGIIPRHVMNDLLIVAHYSEYRPFPL